MRSGKIARCNTFYSRPKRKGQRQNNCPELESKISNHSNAENVKGKKIDILFLLSPEQLTSKVNGQSVLNLAYEIC